MEQAGTGATKPFWMMFPVLGSTPDQLREENESLKKIIAFQDARIAELTVEVWGLSARIATLEQQVEN